MVLPSVPPQEHPSTSIASVLAKTFLKFAKGMNGFSLLFSP